MACSPPSAGLSPLQRDVLGAFFARERGFFLTGGGALVGLRHRTTTNLDLFTLDDAAFERGRHVVADVAAALGATLEVRQDAPGFERFALTRGDEAVIVDLVRERARQLFPEKPEHDGVRVDPPEEILANKLTTLVGRMEERDLVDVLYLERAGYRVEQALDAALAKDGGCTAATLAWLLSEIRIPDGAKLPGAVSAAELRAFVVDLVGRLRRAAAPGRGRGQPG
ncbi:MAG: nucleotidyl transferase AbiEii/AbiGii toxin family protein [Deltaproteobacteria bacterium]|nr:nucleotidyl transferase AbiEii/AbiGii toxin family protein [Deltaproteobacteria bacterium]